MQVLAPENACTKIARVIGYGWDTYRVKCNVLIDPMFRKGLSGQNFLKKKYGRSNINIIS